MKNKKKKKIKIRFDRILMFLLFLLAIFLILKGIIELKITNIYIHNNNFLSEQYIIEKALLEDYSSTLQNPSYKIEKELEKDIYIKDAKVSKKWFTQVHITIEENRPLFYYDNIKKTVLLDGNTIDEIYSVPTVLNYITDNYYALFIEKMGTLNLDVLSRISEIQFSPNEVDKNRFLLTMSDGNYVYINLSTFEKLNKYLSILESLPNKNGILYLDYGNNFEIIE